MLSLSIFIICLNDQRIKRESSLYLPIKCLIDKHNDSKRWDKKRVTTVKIAVAANIFSLTKEIITE